MKMPGTGLGKERGFLLHKLDFESSIGYTEKFE
jgi:hypothetical protein